MAHALVATAQARAGKMAQGLDDALQRQGQDIQSRMTLLTGIGLAIIVVLLLVGVLLVFAQGSALAPFIYTIF